MDKVGKPFTIPVPSCYCPFKFVKPCKKAFNRAGASCTAGPGSARGLPRSRRGHAGVRGESGSLGRFRSGRWHAYQVTTGASPKALLCRARKLSRVKLCSCVPCCSTQKLAHVAPMRAALRTSSPCVRPLSRPER